MIGNPKWFTYRIFGWGLRPKTWQGWVYILIAVGLFGLVTYIPLPDPIKLWVFGLLFVILIADVLHIMIQMPKVHDERENYNQLLIERNCSYAALLALLGLALFQTYKNKAGLGMGAFPFDSSILIILLVMVFTKAASSAYVYWKK